MMIDDDWWWLMIDDWWLMIAATADESDILNLHGVFVARFLPHILDCPQADVVDQQKMPTVKRGFWGPLFRGWHSH